MILWEGREVYWQGRKVIVVEKITKDRVKVAFASNNRVMRIVKREDLYKPPRRRW